jgi:hypothetical protein
MLCASTARAMLSSRIAVGGNGLQLGVMKLGQVSGYTCPDCHAACWCRSEGPIVRFPLPYRPFVFIEGAAGRVNCSIDKGLCRTLRAVGSASCFAPDGGAGPGGRPRETWSERAVREPISGFRRCANWCLTGDYWVNCSRSDHGHAAGRHLLLLCKPPQPMIKLIHVTGLVMCMLKPAS